MKKTNRKPRILSAGSDILKIIQDDIKHGRVEKPLGSVLCDCGRTNFIYDKHMYTGVIPRAKGRAKR